MRVTRCFLLWPALSLALLAQTGPVNLRDGTLVRLKVLHALSSDSVKLGDLVELQVSEDVRAEGATVIARGSSSLATVSTSRQRFTRLTLLLGTVQLTDGKRVALRVSSDRRETSSEIAFEGAAENRPVTLSEGATIEAYVQGDIPVSMNQLPVPVVGPAQDQTLNDKPAAPRRPSLAADVPYPRAEAPASIPGTSRVVLEEGTPVRLRISRTVSSADAQVGETVDFEVLEEVRVGEMLVIPKGGIAWATVTEAQPKRRMGRAGKLGINIDSVRLVDGQKAALRAVKDVKGGSHTGAMTGAIVGTAIVFWPAAPLFLLIHGKDITVPKGTEITAYVNGNAAIRVDQPASSTGPAELASPASPMTQRNAASTESAAAPARPETGTLEIGSTPAGADIEIDGVFVGSTPSALNVPIGDHDLAISKPGFKPWKRKMHAYPGKVTISVTLEK